MCQRFQATGRLARSKNGMKSVSVRIGLLSEQEDIVTHISKATFSEISKDGTK